MRNPSTIQSALQQTAAGAHRDMHTVLKNPTPASARAYCEHRNKAIEKSQSLIASAGINVACRSGCNHCCYLRVTVYQFEAAAIYYDLISRLSKEEIVAIRSSIEVTAKSIRAMTEDEHLHTNTRCALLNSSGKCTAHATRPAACSTYQSHSADVCKYVYDNPRAEDQQRLVDVEAQGHAQALEEGVTVALLEKHSPHERLELHQALDALFTSPRLLQTWSKNRFPIA